jgi:hypothetical protein
MTSHMKTTIEISDDLFRKISKLARQRNTTFRALTEEGLRQVLRLNGPKNSKLNPLITYGGSGLHDAFRDWSWDNIREEIYRSR